MRLVVDERVEILEVHGASELMATRTLGALTATLTIGGSTIGEKSFLTVTAWAGPAVGFANRSRTKPLAVLLTKARTAVSTAPATNPCRFPPEP